MRIAIYTELFPPHIGGQEVRYLELARTLVVDGHDVDVFCINHDPSLSGYEVVEGIKVHRYPLDQAYTRPRIKTLKRRWGTVLRYSLWLRNESIKGRYDVEIYNQWPLLHVLVVGRRRGVLRVLDWCEVRNDALMRLWQVLLPSKVNLNLTVSHAVFEQMGLTDRVAQVVPSGITLKDYISKRTTYSSRPNNIVFAGRLVNHKHPDVLIDVVCNLRKIIPDITLTFIGAGPEESALAHRIKQLDAQSFISLEGFVAEERKLELLGSARVLVLPSEREGFPRVFAEAMALGVPIVTTDYPLNGGKDVVKQYQCGLVCEPEVGSIMTAIQSLLCDQTAAAMISAFGMQAASGMDWHALSEELINRIHKLCN